MSTLHARLYRYRPTDDHLRYAAAGLAYLVAALHVFHPRLGFPRLLLILTLDQPLVLLIQDPRPLAFVLSGLAIIIGVKLVLFEFPRKPIYLAGIALMLTYIIGYFAWHLTGHGGFLPGRTPQLHDFTPFESVLYHMIDEPWARYSKLAESALIITLAILYRRDA